MGGPNVSRTRAWCSDPGDGPLVDLYRDHSVAPLVDLRRRLRAVLDIIAAIGRSGFTVSRSLELTRQWGSIVAAGPQGNVTADDLARISGLGLAGMEASVADLHRGLNHVFCRILFVVGGIGLFMGGRLGFWKTCPHIHIVGFGLILFLLPLFCSVILGTLVMVLL